MSTRKTTAQSFGEIHDCVSSARLSRYLRAVNDDYDHCMRLYAWNLTVSGAFYSPLSLAEVTFRNAVVLAIEDTFDQNWHFSKSFKISLPKHRRRDLEKIVSNLRDRKKKSISASMVVAESTLFFWESLLADGFKNSIWRKGLQHYFPNMPHDVSCETLREDVRQWRLFRNRIAHHEPIFERDLGSDLQRLRRIVGYRSSAILHWLDREEGVSVALDQRPS